MWPPGVFTGWDVVQCVLPLEEDGAARVASMSERAIQEAINAAAQGRDAPEIRANVEVVAGERNTEDLRRLFEATLRHPGGWNRVPLLREVLRAAAYVHAGRLAEDVADELRSRSKLDRETAGWLITALAMAGEWNEAIDRARELWDQGVHPHPKAIDSLVRWTALHASDELVQRCYEEIARPLRRERIYREACIERAVQRGRYTHALELSERDPVPFREMGRSTIQSLAVAHARGGAPEEAAYLLVRAYIEKGLQPSELTEDALNAIMAADEDLVPRMAAVLADAGKDRELLQAMLRAACAKGSSDDALRISASILERYQALNAYELNWLIRTLVQDGLVDLANEYFQRAHSESWGLSGYAVDSLADGLAGRGQPERVFGVLKAAQNGGVKIDEQHLNHLLRAFIEADRTPEAEQALDSFAGVFAISPDAVHFGMVLDSYSLRGDAESCVRLLDKLRKAGLRPNDRHFQAVARAHAARGDIGALEQTLRVAPEALQEPLGSDAGISRWVAMGLVEGGGVRWAIRWMLDRGPDLGLSPTGEVFESVLAGAEAPDWDDVQAATTLLVRTEAPKTLGLVESYLYLLVRAARRDPALAGPLVREGRRWVATMAAQHAIPPSSNVFFNLLMLCREARDAVAAVQVFEEMTRAGIAPQLKHYGPAMEAISHGPEPRRVEELLREALASLDLRAADKTYLYNVAVRAWSHHESADEALRLTQEMRQQGLEPDRYTYAPLGSAVARASDASDESRLVRGASPRYWRELVGLLGKAVDDLAAPVGRLGTLTKTLQVELERGDRPAAHRTLERITGVVHGLGAASEGLRDSGESDFSKATLDAIVGDVIHELNQPIGRLGTTTPTIGIRLAAGDDEGAHLAVERLRSAIRMLGQRLEDYQASISETAGEGTFLLRESVDAVARELQRQGRLDGVSFSASVARDERHNQPLAIAGNPFLFGRALRALIVNAVEAARTTGRTPEVSVHAFFRPGRPHGAPSAGLVEIHVVDNGPGVPLEIRERIFQQGFTTKPGRGLGLGLSTVQSVVEAHGGWLRLLDTGHGATFVMRLPAAPPVARDSAGIDEEATSNGRDDIEFNDST